VPVDEHGERLPITQGSPAREHQVGHAPRVGPVGFHRSTVATTTWPRMRRTKCDAGHTDWM
jgi:hypothetical protein